MFEANDELDSGVGDAYLARLGVDAEPPSAQLLPPQRSAGRRRLWDNVLARHGAGEAARHG